jgi:hypothetical protein
MERAAIVPPKQFTKGNAMSAPGRRQITVYLGQAKLDRTPCTEDPKKYTDTPACARLTAALRRLFPQSQSSPIMVSVQPCTSVIVHDQDGHHSGNLVVEFHHFGQNVPSARVVTAALLQAKAFSTDSTLVVTVVSRSGQSTERQVA